MKREKYKTNYSAFINGEYKTCQYRRKSGYTKRREAKGKKNK